MSIELSDTEMAILIRFDWRNKEIAQDLGLPCRTVEKNAERIFKKLGVKTRTAAYLKAIQLGLVLCPCTNRG